MNELKLVRQVLEKRFDFFIEDDDYFVDKTKSSYTSNEFRVLKYDYSNYVYTILPSAFQILKGYILTELGYSISEDDLLAIIVYMKEEK